MEKESLVINQEDIANDIQEIRINFDTILQYLRNNSLKIQKNIYIYI